VWDDAPPVTCGHAVPKWCEPAKRICGLGDHGENLSSTERGFPRALGRLVPHLVGRAKPVATDALVAAVERLLA
jgi:hypothetical protein